MKTWQFEPLDACFFRGAKPFNSGEGGFLDSQFPPTAQTLAGVIRAAIGESMGVDWAAYRKGNQSNVAAVIGKHADDAGKLGFVGPYVMKDSEQLYPVPLHLLYSGKEGKWAKLQPSNKALPTLPTDMGKKRLPKVEKQLDGAKPLESGWLRKADMLKVLQGGLPSAAPIKKDDVFASESRTGIGRDNHERKTKEGLLYFTRHVRLNDGVRLAMDVRGADEIDPASMLRLGGEGRMAHVQVQVNDAADSRLGAHDGKDKAMIVLLTHADFGGRAEPDIKGLKVVSACVGKAVREGGWDYALKQPKPLKSLVPAGSVFFVEGDVRKLGTHIGERTRFGYGEIAVGIWEDK